MSRFLKERLPGFIARVDDKDVGAVDLAIPDIMADAEILAAQVLPSLGDVSPDDLNALGDALTDLREVLLHTRQQVTAAEEALGRLVDACTAPKT